MTPSEPRLDKIDLFLQSRSGLKQQSWTKMILVILAILAIIGIVAGLLYYFRKPSDKSRVDETQTTS